MRKRSFGSGRSTRRNSFASASRSASRPPPSTSTGLAEDQAVARVKFLAAKSCLPFIVMTQEAKNDGRRRWGDRRQETAHLPGHAGQRRRLHQDRLDTKCPLAVSADTLETLADLAKTARDKGVANLVLSFSGDKPARTIRDLTMARRAALKKNFRPFGYPAMVDVSNGNATKETALASAFAAKYAGIVIISGLDGSELLPILATIQNVYTDPQVPNIVEPKLYEIGPVNENSPVLWTTNFSLTYFCVVGEDRAQQSAVLRFRRGQRRSRHPQRVRGDKVSPEKVVKTLEAQKVADKVKHRRLISPGLLPSFRAEIEDSSPWKQVLIGPENASGIPAFLKENWKS